MPISTDMIVRVAHADIALELGFPRSIRHWQRQGHEERAWKVLVSDCGAVLIGKDDAVVIDGNCSSAISAPDGGTIHIYGNLDSTIDVGGHSEIIICGDVSSKALIEASGFCNVFVGGSFSGQLRSPDSTKVWIDADFSGSIKTGTPSTNVHVGRDYHGSITPNDEPALLSLVIAGFAAQAELAKISDCGYTVFNASIAYSDVVPGLYPVTGWHRKRNGGNSFNRWCVLKNPGSEISLN